MINTDKPALVVASTYYPPVLGGAETAASQLAEFLVTRGHRVTVMTKRTARDVPNREERNGVTVLRLSPYGARTAAGKWLFLPALTRELIQRRDEYAAVICVDFRAIGIGAQIARGITGHPAILHAQTEGVISVGRARESLRRAGITNEVIVNALLWPLQRLYDGGDAYPCISRAIEAETLMAGVSRDRVYYLPNPVDNRRFTAVTAEGRRSLRAAAGIPDDARVAIAVGRLSREKGQLDALKAWALCRHVERGLFVLVGPDMTGHPWNTGPEARAFVEREGLTERVRFVGGVPAGQVVPWLQLADVAVQPSHFEAFGTAAIEAMATGLPVIASDVGGLRDFVEPGVNGFRVPAQQPQAMADALARVLTDDALRATLAAGAAATAPRFDESRVLGEFAAVIEAAICRRRSKLS